MAAYREEIADRSVIAAIKSISEIGRAPDLQAYSRHPKISHRFGERYSIRISFSLHTGRSIEGAVGSEFKVDACYLSTDLQILHRIDQLCDLYDRTILLTGDLQKMLSEKGKEITRMIESVVMNESPNLHKVTKYFINILGHLLHRFGTE